MECDAHPQRAIERLTAILGQPTVVVRSGGQWTDPATGQIHPKLHIHYRLAVPATGGRLKDLKLARDIAARIVGGDATCKTVVHPMRWPGSWHLKIDPILCRVDSVNADAEIDLGNALEKLRTAAPGPPRPNGHDHRNGGSEGTNWAELVASIVAGTNLHQSIRNLAAKMAHRGMSARLDGLVASSQAPHDLRRNARRDDIPRAVDTAQAKFARARTYQDPDGTLRQQPEEEPADLETYDAGDDTGPPPPRGWLQGGIWCRKFLSGVFASGGIGKSTLRYLQAISQATGRPLAGHHVFFRGRVLLLSLEDDRDEMRRRIDAVCRHHGVDRTELKGWFFYSAPKGLKLAEMRNGTRRPALSRDCCAARSKRSNSI